MPLISKDTLQSFADALLQAAGTSPHFAQLVAASLVGANLRGHDSHGVMRIPFYIGRIQEGRLHPEAELTIETESDSLIAADGGWGFGQVLCQDLTNRLLDKAEATGIACGTLRQSAHCGRLGEYAEMAAAINMAALLCANTHGAAQRVAPVGGKRPRLGTNPICIGMPGGADGPFILDFGTSATAEGKVRVKKIAGEQVPPGWILDPDGNPTTDPNALYGDPPGTILPLGGDQAYKGFGLSFMIEMLCSALSGAPTANPKPSPPLGNAVFMVIISPDRLAGMPHLNQEVRQLEEHVRSCPKIDDSTQIMLPGDPERKAFEQRSQTGIPLDDGNWAALVALAAELGVTAPPL